MGRRAVWRAGKESEWDRRRRWCLPFGVAAVSIEWVLFGPGNGILFLALFLGGGFLLRRRLEAAEIAAFIPDPAPAEAFVATIGLFGPEGRTGSDRGLVSFLDGWLLFEGRRTSFALRSLDVLSLRPDGGDLEARLREGAQVLVLNANDGEFHRRFLLWFRANEAAEGEPTLPPLERMG